MLRVTLPSTTSSTPWKPPAVIALVVGVIGGVLWIVGYVAEINYVSTLLILLGLGLVVVAAIFVAMAAALFLLGKLRWR